MADGWDRLICVDESGLEYEEYRMRRLALEA